MASIAHFRLKEEGYFKHGKLEGIQKVYSPKSSLHVGFNCHKGKLEGIERMYFGNGKK